MASLSFTVLFILLPTIHCSMSAVDNVYKNYVNYKLINIKGDANNMGYLKNALMNKTRDESIIFVELNKESQVLVPPDLYPLFDKIVTDKKLTTQVLYDDVSEVIRKEKPSEKRYRNEFSWKAYYDVDDFCMLPPHFMHLAPKIVTIAHVIYRYLQNMSTSYPQWTETIVGGKSYEGRQLLGLRINSPGQDNYTEHKPVFFIESGIHAREWIAPATTTYFINQLLTSSDPKIVALRNHFDWRIFPTVNPDGYHYSYVYDRYWRKTRSHSANGCRGADPNRNWDYNWGQHSTSEDPCDYQLYAGSQPFSEIETQTLSSYISGIDNLLIYVAFHSYASLLLVPYSDSTIHVDNYEDLVRVGKTSLEYGEAVYGNKYRGPGTAAETLYKVSGGSMDWVRNKLNTQLVYTYELRGSSFHWPPWRISEQGDEVTQMMLGLATEARNMGFY